MTEKEYRSRMSALIEAEYELLDASPAYLDDATAWKLVVAGLAKRMQAEAERDHEFKCAWHHARAARHIAEYLKDARPQGAYRSDGIIPIDGGLCVQMPMATREHLLAWALQETNERNLAYIKSRLDRWESHPECK